MDYKDKIYNITDILDDEGIRYHIKDFTKKDGKNYTKIVVDGINVFKKEWQVLKDLNFSIGMGYYYKTFEEAKKNGIKKNQKTFK